MGDRRGAKLPVTLGCAPRRGRVPAFDALVERVAVLVLEPVAVLVLEPWDAAVIPPDNDPAYRRTVFGAGYGLLSFRADEAAELIRIFDILWMG